MHAGWDRDGVAVFPARVDDACIAAALAHLGDRSGLVAGAVNADAPLLALARAAPLVAAAEDVLGPGVQVLAACYVVKPPHSPAFARWHQDGGRWPLSSLDAATVRVALDAGPFLVAPGSHRLGVLEHSADDASIFGTGVTAAPSGVGLDLDRGDVSVHHPLLLHASAPNDSTARRAALVVRYVAADVSITAVGWPPLLPARP